MRGAADAPRVSPSGRTRVAAGSTPPERPVHHYAGEHRPTLRMPSAQLRELVAACDQLAEGTIDSAVEPAAYRLTVTATNDRGDCAFVIDSPSQDVKAFTRTDLAADHAPKAAPARDDSIEHALDRSIGSIDESIDGSIDVDLDDDTVDDFEAQPTAYRVRTTTLDSLLATLPPR